MRQPWETAVYRAQCATYKVAQELTGKFSLISRGHEYYGPPFCLRVVPEYRTQAMKDFRDLVAKTVRERRTLR